MTVRAEFEADWKYYKDAYIERLQRTRYLRWEPWIGLLALLLGLPLLLFGLYGGEKLFYRLGYIVTWVGIVELGSAFFRRWRWTRRIRRRADRSSVVSFEFSQDGVSSEGFHSSATTAWPGISRAETTARGLLLWDEDGQMVYVPRDGFEQENGIETVLEYYAASRT